MFDYRLFDLDTFNREGFSDMYKLCFAQNVDEGYFKWKYGENPAGKVIGLSAASGNTVSGFYGIIPENYLINGKPCKVYQSMDTMTHPSFQKKGLFTTLAEKTYEELFSREPQSLIIGIPGNNSYPGFVNKLKWKALHHFSFSFIHRSVFKLRTLFYKPAYEVKSITDFFDPAVVAFLQKTVKQDQKIRPLIDPAFLDWRIKRHPNIQYKTLGLYGKSGLAGMVIYRITENNACFIDWVESISALDKKQVLGSFCHFIFKNYPLKFIYTWKPLDKKNAAAFGALGFLTNPFKKGPFSYKVPFIVYSKTNEINGVNLYDIHSYDLQPIIQD